MGYHGLKTEFSKINGKYVSLRLLTEDDAENTFLWRQSQRASLLNKGAKDIDSQREWIKSRPNDELNYMIELKDGSAVGMLSLVNINLTNRNAETARFLIGEEEMVKGKPVAVEAMLLLYNLAFDRIGLVRLYGTVASKNTLMIKWQKYLGMKEEGVLRKHYFIDNCQQDAVMLGILKHEYETVAHKRMTALIGTQ